MSTALATVPVEEVVDYKTRDAWLAARRTLGVGASEAGGDGDLLEDLGEQLPPASRW